jgi:TPR repeat protein
MREGRRVTIENLPSQKKQGFYNVEALHKMLFSFNIYAVRAAQHVNARVSHLSGWMAQVDFETAIDAQKACDIYNRSMIGDNRLYFGITRPSIKSLGGVSWETGRPGEHFSARDLGSAKGTNFEKVCIAP